MHLVQRIPVSVAEFSFVMRTKMLGIFTAALQCVKHSNQEVGKLLLPLCLNGGCLLAMILTMRVARFFCKQGSNSFQIINRKYKYRQLKHELSANDSKHLPPIFICNSELILCMKRRIGLTHGTGTTSTKCCR